ncbi:MAG: hypothetical protein NXI04_12655 [Planctomycetaceae bacterium]|nr:hypothetical protein [Planctomycetaceae bacterium]
MSVFRPTIRIPLLAVALSVPLLACQVPVFRYALERWNADRYQVFVIHQGDLNASQQAAVKALQTAADAKSAGQSPMIEVTVAGPDDKSVPAAVRSRYEAGSAKSAMFVYYPAANGVGRTQPMHECKISTDSVDMMLDSPVRKKVREKLQQGDSAVWIFVPCGRDADDKAALKRLQDQLAADEQWMELPTPEELEVAPDVLTKVKVPLQIKFSTVILKRDAPAEQFLLQSLLNSEEDLTSFDQPLAFPVFGRGRVLYALVGKGIAADTVRTASSFMAGPCSCQVKNQNPGFDLLLRADWEKALGEVLISEPIESVDTEALAPKLLTIPPGRKSKN